jgi:hypothetical protein
MAYLIAAIMWRRSQYSHSRPSRSQRRSTRTTPDFSIKKRADASPQVRVRFHWRIKKIAFPTRQIRHESPQSECDNTFNSKINDQ